MSTLRFPDNFLWGTATASFTNEGAAAEDGKGESIWDRFACTPGHIVDGSTPEVACDHYHRFREDVALMRDLGLNSYSFSISWPRLFPTGRNHLNDKGMSFYDRLVDELLAAGITPLATLYHWDLPQVLENMGGWTEPDMVPYFADYASTCFDRLGDRVKLWFTLNEPVVHASMGYCDGVHAPGRKSREEMVKAAHWMLVAHGSAVERFRQIDAGRIGIIVNQGPVHPATDSGADRAAVERFDTVLNRWFLDPIMLGDYPDLIKERYPLPRITDVEQEMISQAVDFLGINYYTRVIVADNPDDPGLGIRGVDPPGVPRTSIGWEVYPEGLYEALTTVRDRYGDIPLYVTENGASFNDVVNGAGGIDDRERIEFLRKHLVQAHRAIDAGVDLRGFFVYTLMDNFECALGCTPKFGLVRTDFESQERTVKASGRWYGEIARSNAVPAG